jgi:surfactin synthase thioesterase subunit
LRLFCLACAGGTAASFAEWRRRSSRLDVHAVEYPGRGSRWSEHAARSLKELARAVEVEVRNGREGGYALLGHSLGGLVAFEVARLLVRAGSSLPLRLCIVAAAAPHIPQRERIHQLPDGEFVEKVVEYGGVPPEVLESEELLSLVVPVVRSDFRLIEQYDHDGGEPLPIPISVFGGLDDDAVPAADLLAWSTYTSKSFRCRFYPGGHFFLHDPQLPVIADVESDLNVSSVTAASSYAPWQATTA